MLTVGIDPGLSGAIAVIGPEPGQLRVEDLPTLVSGSRSRLNVARFLATLDRLSRLQPAAIRVPAYLEQVTAMPRQGVGSAFNFGRTYGEIRGALIAMRFELHDVTPQTWKFALGLRAEPGADTKARKAASRARAIELFPEAAHLFARAKDDGRAEAALIAFYGAMCAAASPARKPGDY